MPATITTIQQKIEVTGVEDVVVTEIGTDDDGHYVRDFRFYGPAADGESKPLLVQVRAKGDARSVLEITTPPLQV